MIVTDLLPARADQEFTFAAVSVATAIRGACCFGLLRLALTLQPKATLGRLMAIRFPRLGLCNWISWVFEPRLGNFPLAFTGAWQRIGLMAVRRRRALVSPETNPWLTPSVEVCAPMVLLPLFDQYSEFPLVVTEYRGAFDLLGTPETHHFRRSSTGRLSSGMCSWPSKGSHESL